MINIRLLVMLASTAFAAALAAVVLAYGIGRHQGSVSERKACEAELHAAELTAERQARETERKAQKLPVYISEYQMPEERFACIAEWDKVTTMASKTTSHVTERLWRPRCQLDI